jgi:hypothetical protein
LRLVVLGWPTFRLAASPKVVKSRPVNDKKADAGVNVSRSLYAQG